MGVNWIFAGNATELGFVVIFGSTNYSCLSILSGSPMGAETNAQQPFPTSTVTFAAIWITNNTLDQDATFTLRKNGAGTAMTVTIPAGNTGEFTATGSILVADGDLLDYEYDASTSTVGNLEVGSIRTKYYLL